MLPNKKTMSPIDDYLFKSLESLESFMSFELFAWMQFNTYSFNYLCEKDFNHVNLFLRGFNVAYLLFLIEVCMLY